MNPSAVYVETEIPPGMTCDEYRRRLAQIKTAERRGRRLRLRPRVRRAI